MQRLAYYRNIYSIGCKCLKDKYAFICLRENLSMGEIQVTGIMETCNVCDLLN